jgi:DNA-binding NtrC family response regulator
MLIPLFSEILKNHIARERQRETIERLQKEWRAPQGGMIFESRKMHETMQLAMKLAKTESPVLILGETGTGKELIARFVHEHSQRIGKPYKAINCGAIPENLMESELFGHEKGAFTGATNRKIGLFEAAQGGTLLLDEIGELPLQLQVKLLRVLQEGEIIRVGGNETITINVRIVAATNKNLEKEIEDGRFRRDLYFRLNVLAVELPPLRDRDQDILLLAEYFVHRYCEQFGILRKRLTTDARSKLLRHTWPGNIRELENIIQKACLLSEDKQIDEKDIVLPKTVLQESGIPMPLKPATLKEVRAEAERSIIAQTLKKTGGNVSQTAKILDIDRKWLIKKMEDLQVSADRFRR